jgi:hypothetical protein
MNPHTERRPGTKPYDSILTLSPEIPLSENGFWYLWCLTVTCYCALEFETSEFREYFRNSQNHCTSLL